ncbi:MAG: hypothetical protein IJY71_01470 [Clostridia bacterium]|nr:hypothetical protein [Clostridia bacterium]
MTVFTLATPEYDKGHSTYARKHPPNSSVSETWTTYGFENGGAIIRFVQYDYYDLDPDGVREAYGCLYDDIHTVTPDTSEADPEKLFAYTVTMDGKVERGLSLDLDAAAMVLVLAEPHPLTDEALLSAYTAIQEAHTEKKLSLTEGEALLRRLLFDGREDVLGIAVLLTA